MVEVSYRSGHSVMTLEQIIRGHVTPVRIAAVVAAVCKELRIPKPGAAAC